MAVDPGAARMLIGINDGYHSPLPPELVAHYCASNRDVVLRSPVLSAEQATAVRQSVASCPRIKVLLLIEDANVALAAALAPDLQRPDLPPVWGVELGNERDLAGMTPQHWRVRGLFTTPRGGFRDIVTGGIYTVDRPSRRISPHTGAGDRRVPIARRSPLVRRYIRQLAGAGPGTWPAGRSRI
jgi:hypothetical protein